MKDTVPQFDFQIKNGALNGYTYIRGTDGWMNTVILSDEITTINMCAMKKFSCMRLVMPPSLKTINHKAFDMAQIDEIDFSQCKLLERIEFQAFLNCRIKATLPDTITYLGDGAVHGLILGKAEKLRLPSALSHIGRYAFDLRNFQVLEVDERLVAQDSGLEELMFLTDDVYNSSMILNVTRDGKLVCRTLIPLNREIRRYKNRYICAEGFNYSNYDNWYKHAKDRQSKSIIAAFRVMFPEGLTDETIKIYRTYATKNLLAMIEGFEEDMETIKLYYEAGFITTYRLKQLLENARQKSNVEVASEILDLLERKNGIAAKSLRL
ncbi:MAG: leucine-rich repeat domain-containing protein [Clostridiales bacterium]|jgi:hypothetical protein|nr:leucine-rich repeat domain-containing protein [Clostridiales bacterium]MDR2752416.1 leucine-rich repeat domain-containing protein [Clostridiales bacterium]